MSLSDLRLLPQLSVDVALVSIGCVTPECVRVVPAGDVVYMRKIVGTAAHEPICAPCAVAIIEDARLRVRLELHAEEQRRAGRALAALPTTMPEIAGEP